MDRAAFSSSPSDSKTASPSNQSSPSDHERFSCSFAEQDCSIFAPKPPTSSPLPSSLSLTPSTSSPPSMVTAVDDLISTEHRLHQARVILEYRVLCDHYELSLSRLQMLTDELDFLRRENTDLRLVNTELLKLLSASSKRSQKRNLNRLPSPKAISFLSSPSTRSESEREEDVVEMEVYNQGTWKTELCNKWEQNGTCPYGKKCQFAHGINELRPVIRHPRYKTQACRMVLAGEVCPYAHRCHFRHSLTEQERRRLVMGPR